MNFYQIERFVAFGLCALVMVLIAVYVALVLPRVRAKIGYVLTLTGAAALVAGSWMATYRVSLGLIVCSAALIAAHFGWVWGRLGSRRMAARLPARTRSFVSNQSMGSLEFDQLSSEPPNVLTKAPVTQKKLGHFSIDREIGRGSMGAVYLGVDPQTGQSVAIKTMALGQEFEGEALEEARKRFFREANAAGRLSHPGIVTILETGEDHDLAYIAMEFINGQDLQAFIQPGRLLAVPTVLSIVARVADALAYAHSKGVIHRDIKPANVMVDLASDVVKVMDFGIALVSDNLRTRTGMVLGTPSFMSPEQLSGNRVDGRSDIYSLGVMLFQLLTGRLPHQAATMAQVMYMIANEPAPSLQSIRSDLPQALSDVVALALEKQPETRYADGHQFALDLREVSLRYGLQESRQTNSVTPATGNQSDSDFAATVAFMRAEKGHNRQA